MAESDLARLRRWEDAGGTWQVVGRRVREVTVSLRRCDGGEEVERLVSGDPSLLARFPATVEYLSGRFADTYGAPGSPPVLLWHGSGPNERHVLRPLAEAIAAAGRFVVVPDWDSTSTDRGRADLLGSLDFVLGLGVGRISVVGWSLGGTAAAGVAAQGAAGIDRVVTLAGGFETDDPISASPLRPPYPNGAERPEIVIMHGTLDDIVPVSEGRAAARGFESAGWRMRLLELPVDHAGIVGTRFDQGAGECVPDPSLGAVVAQVVEEVVRP